MVDTNYISCVVKILEKPLPIVLNSTIPVTKFRVQLPQIRGKKKRIVELVFWGKLSQDVVNYYQIQDYILVEGYLSLRNKPLINSTIKNSKKVTITVLKIYPFLLSSNRDIRTNKK
jgi:hypothetical protein